MDGKLETGIYIIWVEHQEWKRDPDLGWVMTSETNRVVYSRTISIEMIERAISTVNKERPGGWVELVTPSTHTKINPSD